MKQIFETNLDRLARICPKTSLILPYVDTSGYRLCLTKEAELNLRRGDFFFHAQTKASEEAKAYVSPFLGEEAETLFIYGIGLAYSYFAAKEWLKEDSKRRLVYLEDDLKVLRLLLDTERGSELLENPQVRIAAIDPDRLVFGHSGIDGVEVLIEACMSSYHILALPSYWLEKQKSFQKVIQGIKTLLYLFGNRLNEELNHSQLAANFYQKFIHMDSALPLSELLHAFSKIPCIICGAGASIVHDLPLLKSLSERAIVFGAGSGMNILNAHGIYPQFGGGIDPTEVQFSRIRTNAAFETPFFFTNRFSSEAFEWIHGPKIFTPVDPEKKWYDWFQKEIGIENFYGIKEGFSTSNFCTSVALFLGCDPVIYLGMDMSFGGGEKYASGVEIHPADNKSILESMKRQNNEAFTVVNYEGKSFDTTLAYVNESAWMTNLAEKNPQISFLYASQEGLGVNKVLRKPFVEVLERHLGRQYDLLGQIHAALEVDRQSVSVSAEKAEEVMMRWKASLAKCEELLSGMIEECKKRRKGILDGNPLPSVLFSGKWVLYETELQEEEAFKYLMENVEMAEGLRRADQIINLRNKKEEMPLKEVFLAELDLASGRYQKMAEVAKLHLSAISRAKFNKPVRRSVAFEDKKGSQVYSFQNGILKIYDPECSIDFEEEFHPILIPDSIKKKNEWKEREPVGEVYAHTNSIYEGECLQFYQEGALKARQYYINGMLHGPSTFFNKDGSILDQSWFIRGKREGRATRYFASGQLYAIERWQYGVREGLQEYYYPGGSYKSALEFSNGILNGAVKLFHPNGSLKLEANFKQGLRQGKEYVFDENGLKLMEAEYNSGRPVGTALAWHRNGVLSKKTVYGDNFEQVSLSEWDIEGNLIKEEIDISSGSAEAIAAQARKLKKSIDGMR